MTQSNEFSNLLTRHIQFLTADSISHFRYMDSAPGDVTARDMYYKVSTRVRINLLDDGSTYVQARGESGRSFNASYDYSGFGMHMGEWSYNLKDLYLGQEIGKHFEAQAGGVEFDRGAGTEATSADNDGWLEGYRLIYKAQGHRAWPDKISATVGYVGDFAQPNAFARLHRMGDENYVQVLAQKGFGANREASAEFNSIQSVRYTREALRWQKLPIPVVQGMQLEALTRLTDNATFGWSGNLYRDMNSKLRVGAFYSDIPKGMFQKGTTQIFLNGDRFALGKRVGPLVTFTPFRNFDVSWFGSKRVDNTPGTRYRTELAFRYQLASLLNRIR